MVKYKIPQELLHDIELSREEKIRLLKEWAIDEKLKAVAEEENMQRTSNNGHNQLSLVLQALLDLGVDFDPHGSATNK